MITITTKDWLASNAGTSECFSAFGVAYSDPDGISRNGSTGDVINAFYVAHLLGKDTTIIIAGTSYNALKVINSNNDITMDDVGWVYNNMGSGSDPLYCSASATPQPTPSPTPIVTTDSRAGEFEFVAPAEGEPTIIMNLFNISMRQTGDGHFEMDNISIRNTSPYPIYIAIRMRLFAGSIPACLPSGFVFDGMDRTDTALRNLRIKAMEIGEVAEFDADFFQPSTILGTHTVCILIHGAWTRDQLEAEIESVPG